MQERDEGPEPRAEGHADGRVYGITTAEISQTDDISRRQKQYIYTMLVRVVSIFVVVLVPGISWPIRILLMILGAVLPFFAVVRANGSSRPPDPTNLLIGPPQGHQLNQGQPGLPQGDDTIAGEAWQTGESAGSGEGADDGPDGDRPVRDGADRDGAGAADGNSADRADD